MSVYIMPRTRGGVVETGKYEVKIQFKWPDGSTFRQRFIVGNGTAYPVRTERQARAFGDTKEKELWAAGPPKPKTEEDRILSTEAVTKWWSRYLQAAEMGKVGRKNKGKPQSAVDDRRGRFKKYIEPELGHLNMAAVTPNHLRAIVEKLDEQIRVRLAFYVENDHAHIGAKPGISAKTAAHVWSELTSGFREAVGSKISDLRVEGMVDPTVNVMPPMKTDERTQAALYPAEAWQLLSCEAIPLSRRRCYAVAIYTGMRRSELERFTAADVDFEHERITVHGSKSVAAMRRVPIESALLPLLKRLVKERPSGPLLDVPRADGKWGAAWLTQHDMELAKLTRTDLLRDDDRMTPYTFHAHRHTAITWSWVLGRDETWLKIVYGHTMNEMTRRYLDAEALGRATYGVPFPELPPSVLGGAIVVPFPRTA